MNARERDRRRFLKDGAALAGLAVGAVRSASSGQASGPETPPAGSTKDTRAYGERSRFENSARKPAGAPRGPFGQLPIFDAPLQDQLGMLTPSGLHYVNNQRYETVDRDPRQHRLLIHGLVDRPLIFTLEELKRLPSVSRVHFLECGGNTNPARGRLRETVQQTHGKTSCSEWTGVLLSLLLREAGVQDGANWVVAEGADAGKHTRSLLLEKALDDVLVAYGQNGEAVRPEQGYPFRLLIPGWQGVNNIKWLRRIKVVEQPYMTRSESAGSPSLRPDGKARWYQFELGPKSVITFPSGGQRLPGHGFYEITGLAWSGLGTVRRVEVSTDGGRSWKDAELQEPALRMAHRRFRLAWNWNGEEAVLQSRSTDDQGAIQPTTAEFARNLGLPPDYFPSTEGAVRFNGIQPWKVTRDGSVHNAMFA